ncbi:MAG: hypothetical protein R3D98_11750 [Candidatus Krumholzibacteriia bacterium]
MKTPRLLLATLLISAAAATAAVVPGDQAPDFRLRDTEGQLHHLGQDLATGKIVVLGGSTPTAPSSEAPPDPPDDERPRRRPPPPGCSLARRSRSGAEGDGARAQAQPAGAGPASPPVLLDADGKVGQRYGATNAPHVRHRCDGKGRLRGRDRRQQRHHHARRGQLRQAAALADLAAGRPVQVPSTKAYGCSVKY